MICLSCKDTGRTLGLRETGLGLASYNQRWPQRRQCWPELPAQPFRSTSGLLCLCLFNSNGIQAREIHYCFCQGGLRLAERMHRRALTGVSTCGGPCVWSPLPAAAHWKGSASPPGFGGRKRRQLSSPQARSPPRPCQNVRFPERP